MRISDWSSDVCSSDLPVLDYDGGARFDVVCTHCFLGYFTPEQRPALMAKWFSLLRPGGRVLTVTPIRPTPDHAFVRSEERRVGKEGVSKCSSRELPYH